MNVVDLHLLVFHLKFKLINETFHGFESTPVSWLLKGTLLLV